jgi:hypothetical protein
VLQFVDQGFGLASEAGCKTPFTFSKQALAEKFLDFSDAPDELVPGINYDELPCPKGKKASKKCKEKNGETDDEESSSKSRGDSQPIQSSTPPEATTAVTQTTQASAQSSATPSDVQSSATPTDVQSSATPTDAQSAQTSVQSSVTPTDTQPIDTSIQSSSTSSDPSPTATANCEAIGREDMEDLLQEDPSREQDPVEKRTVGTTLQNRRLEARKYGPKTGSVCDGSVATDFKSKPYPGSGDEYMVSRMYIAECSVFKITTID